IRWLEPGDTDCRVALQLAGEPQPMSGRASLAPGSAAQARRREEVIPYIKAFFWDETAFRRYMRAAIYILFVCLQFSQNSLTATKWGWWIVQFMPVLAFLIGAGDKNAPVPKEP